MYFSKGVQSIIIPNIGNNVYKGIGASQVGPMKGGTITRDVDVFLATRTRRLERRAEPPRLNRIV